jgi:hypothetical protein
MSLEQHKGQQALAPCQYCFEPSSPVIMTEMFSTTRERQSSEPVRVPDSSASALINNQPQSQSSGYESGFGNGLSPTTTNWTLG